MLLFARPEDQGRLKQQFKSLVHVPFGFEQLGSQVVLYSTQDVY